MQSPEIVITHADLESVQNVLLDLCCQAAVEAGRNVGSIDQASRKLAVAG